jgi:hypothetical protein
VIVEFHLHTVAYFFYVQEIGTVLFLLDAPVLDYSLASDTIF